MPGRTLLVLAGQSIDGFQGDPVVDAFEATTARLLGDVFDAAAVADVDRRWRYARAGGGFSPWAVAPPRGRRQVCVTGAGHILYHEAHAAGFHAEFAPLDDFFALDDDGRVVIADHWRPALDGVDVVAVSTTFVLQPPVLAEMLRLLADAGKTIVVGGVLVNKLPVGALRQLDFDYCLKTEAEGRFSEVLRQIARGAPDPAVLDGIPGMVWRQAGALHAARAPFALIDFPGWRTYPTPEWIRERDGMHQYESVRGCPFRCEFCDYPFLMGNKTFRMKSADDIHAEWTELRRRGVTHIDALDSLFTVPKRRIEQLAALMRASGLDRALSWACYARATELADPAFVDTLAQAGCRYIFIGLESGAQTILDTMNKRTTVAENAAAVRNCNAAGIYTSGGILVGFPGETDATVDQTLEMLAREAPPSVHVFVWIPDFTEDSPVPIMQPSRLQRHGIAGDRAPARYEIELWGRRVPFALRTTWSHATMNQERALAHAARISDAITTGAIEAEDFSFAPYRRLIRHPARLAGTMRFRDQVRFALGWKRLYRRYLAGIEPDRLGAEARAWLGDCGFVFDGGSDLADHPYQ